jgi:hypothetical protein
MEGEGQLDHAEVGGQVAAGARRLLDEKGADLVSEPGESVGVESTKVGRRVDRLQDGHCLL